MQHVVIGLLFLFACLFVAPTLSWIVCDAVERGGAGTRYCYPLMGLFGLGIGVLGILYLFGIVGKGGGYY